MVKGEKFGVRCEDEVVMPHPRVSIVTVVHNRASTLNRAIDSVASQTYTDLEYLVVDGGSTDGTLDVIQSHATDIDRWWSEADRGIYHAMNKGIKRSRGDVIGLLNSDDWYEPDTVEAVMRVFNADESADLVHGQLRVWASDSDVHAVYGRMDSYSPLLFPPFHHPTCFVRRSVYRDLGLYDERFPTAADYDFMLRFVSSCKRGVYLNRILANFSRGGATTRSVWSPYGQLWRVLRKNGFGWNRCVQGMLFRALRDSAVTIVQKLLPFGVDERLRRWIPYQT